MTAGLGLFPGVNLPALPSCHFLRAVAGSGSGSLEGLTRSSTCLDEVMKREIKPSTKVNDLTDQVLRSFVPVVTHVGLRRDKFYERELLLSHLCNYNDHAWLHLYCTTFIVNLTHPHQNMRRKPQERQGNLRYRKGRGLSN